MALALRYAARSDVGLLRDGNEDSAYAGPRLLVVADGMGGHAAGEVASSVAVTTMAELDDDAPGSDVLDRLATTVMRANDVLREMVAAEPSLEGMGTTLTALLRSGARLGLVHVGDSRCYLLRDGEFRLITHDHTFVQTLVDEGRITEDEADHHPQRSLITRALDGRGAVEPDLSIRELRLGDRYLLCSDGLSGVVSAATMAETVRTCTDPADACEALIQLALRGGGPDNITCIVADVVDDGSAASEIPQTVGAAAEPTPALIDRRGSPGAAGRAAALRSGHGTEASAVGADSPRHRGRWLRPGFVLTVLLALLFGSGIAAYAWSQQHYFVGAYDERVAIYRGLSEDVGGMRLSDVVERQDVTLDELPTYSRERVAQAIEARDLAHAHRIVEQLSSQARECEEAAARAALAAAQADQRAKPTPKGTAKLTGTRRPRPSATAATGCDGVQR